MDPKKLHTVFDWPTPTSGKDVQLSNSFANFYRKFMRNFSSVAAPLHALTSSKVSFSWSPPVEADFLHLKQSFDSATSSPYRIILGNLLWRWTLPKLESEPFLLYALVRTTRSIPMHIYLGSVHLLKETTRWGIESFWQWSLPSGNGDIGWRGRSNHFWYGQVTRI